MDTRRNFLKKSGIIAATVPLSGMIGWPLAACGSGSVAPYTSKRPAPTSRKFTSKAVEEAIAATAKRLKDPKLAWMFENCFPNTLDTTVEYSWSDGIPDTFVITGDIPAMWLRDSSAQVWPYLSLAGKDEQLRRLLAGVIRRQIRCILIDPYANAFYKDEGNSEWLKDKTDMKKELHERKWEIDSLCYPVRLAYNYWKTTGDASVFDDDAMRAAQLIYDTFRQQQRKDGLGPYRFQRVTDRQLDTVSNDGYGQPLNPVGLINSTFRPSDDATTYGFLIPSNMFAVVSLRQLAEMSRTLGSNAGFAAQCGQLADEVEKAVKEYGIVEHKKYGRVYAYEVDGFGNASFMDDANVPGLLSLPYLGCVSLDEPVYQNTRKLVCSTDNPYFFKGTAAEGIGGPHVGYDMVWPMSIIMRAMTSTDKTEIDHCVRTLRDTDANTGFMHESFHKDDPTRFTRKWFAWANTLFGELIMKLLNDRRL
ncbi:MAG: glycoside hydrolase family 125 protein [Bacteroidales bacterium]|jgi:meiotically up-regulated gene 157 (Mug157) protein|nr:glycoside hydrolase family 125 protein [Bacteroidales bacterium]